MTLSFYVIPELLKTAAMHPQKLAVVLDDQSWSYSEMIDNVKRVVCHLNRMEMTKGQVIYQFVERSLEMVCGLLGIMCAGGVYCAINPTDPPDRVTQLVDQARGKYVLLHQKTCKRFPSNATQQVILLDPILLSPSDFQEVNDLSVWKESDPVFMIYTSGTTGRPKAIVHTHRSFAASNYTYIHWNANAFTYRDHVLQVATCSWILHLSEIVLPLIVGGTVVLMRPNGHLDMAYCSQTLFSQHVTTIIVGPAIIRALTTYLEKSQRLETFRSMRKICIGGEPMKHKEWLRFITWLNSAETQIHPCYGMSECFGVLGCQLTDMNDPVFALGYPMPGVHCLLIDEQGNRIDYTNSPSRIGEIHISGSSLFNCYLDDPERTAKMFTTIDDRVYLKTGDLARYNVRGELVHAGRVDFQIKIRGQRVETREIEDTIIKCSSDKISNCLVMKHPSNENLVIAYIISNDSQLNIEQIRDFCDKQLPQYMVPSYFLILDKFPLNAVGKIDRKNLPIPDLSTMSTVVNDQQDRESTDEIETLIHSLWCELLGFNRISSHVNFFTIGGHSLVLIQLYQRYSTMFTLDMKTFSIGEFFRYPTIDGHACLIRQSINTQQPSAVPLPVTHVTQGQVSEYQQLVEKRLYNIWCSLLNLQFVNFNDSFFDIGGNSLLFSTLIEIIQKEFFTNRSSNLPLPIDQLVKATTIRAQTTVIEENLKRLQIIHKDCRMYINTRKLCARINVVKCDALSENRKTKDGAYLPTERRRSSVNSDISLNRRQLQSFSSVYKQNDCAVIGMAGVFPGCNNIDEFWSMLKEGRSGITTLPDDELRDKVSAELLANPYYIRRTGRLTCGIDLFDPTFFGMTSREASLTDPQHRLLLEIVYRACEDAAINLHSPKETISCFIAASDSSYYSFNLKHLCNTGGTQPSLELQIRLNNMMGTMATRVAYSLDFTGAAINMNTACSSSLVILQTAMDHLRLGRCTTAVVGTSCIHSPSTGYLYELGNIYSSNGQCAPFDRSADGTVFGDAVCAIVLKLVEPAVIHRHHIRALIKSCAVNNNGSTSQTTSFTAPSAIAQAACIVEAMAEANVNATDIAYVEAHGTGTTIGDVIEVEGLTQAFNTTQRQYCTLGSVKSNIGHTDTAAGLVGLIKTVLVLEHRYIPGTLHFQSPNPNIDFSSTPFIVRAIGSPLEESRLQHGPLFAGVTSLGMGGTNAHAILQEYRRDNPCFDSHDSLESAIHQVTISGKDLESLKANCQYLISWLQKQTNEEAVTVRDICYTLNNGRTTYEYRLATTVDSPLRSVFMDTLNHLVIDNIKPSRSIDRIVFMFPGQHTCSRSLIRQFYLVSDVFKNTFDRCVMILQEHDPSGPNMIDILMNDDDESTNQEWKMWMGLTAFIVEYCLITFWSRIIKPPYIFIGHSIGEYVVAIMTGVFTLEEALKLVYTRICLINRQVARGREGALLAVRIDKEQAVQHVIDGRISLAAVNGPTQCVFAGDVEAIDELKLKLTTLNYKFKQLEHPFPFHSHMITSSILDEFRQAYKHLKIEARPTKMSFVSTVTGDWYNEGCVVDVDYWCRHMRQTVLWNRAIQTLEQLQSSPSTNHGNATIYIECSLSNVLTNVTKACVQTELSYVLSSISVNTANIELSVKKTLNACWCYGLDDIDYHSAYVSFINSSRIYRNASLISMPGHVFKRRRHWIDPPSLYLTKTSIIGQQSVETNDDHEDKPSEDARLPKNLPFSSSPSSIDKLIEIYISVTGDLSINAYSDFFSCGGDSHTALVLISRINSIFNIQLTNKDLMEVPIVEQLATRIEQIKQQQTVQSSLTAHLYNDDCIIMLKQGKHALQPPIFVIAPSGGTCFIYRDLCKHLDASITVLGLKYPKISATSSCESYSTVDDDSVVNLASYYIKILRRVQPNARSYTLVGTSFGGMVGYEMSQQLCKLSLANLNLIRLFMIDTPTRDSLPIHFDNTTVNGTKRSRAFALWTMFNVKYSLSLDEVEQVCTHNDDQLKQFCIDKKILSSNNADLDLEFRELCHYIDIFERNIRAIDDYSLEPMANQVTHVTFVQVKSLLPHYPVDSYRVWSQLIPVNQFNLVHVDGDHLSINTEPYVQELAKLINETFLSNIII